MFLSPHRENIQTLYLGCETKMPWRRNICIPCQPVPKHRFYIFHKLITASGTCILHSVLFFPMQRIKMPGVRTKRQAASRLEKKNAPQKKTQLIPTSIHNVRISRCISSTEPLVRFDDRPNSRFVHFLSGKICWGPDWVFWIVGREDSQMTGKGTEKKRWKQLLIQSEN